MKYSGSFCGTVRKYRGQLAPYKNILVVLDTESMPAFLSIAPLSRAAHLNSSDLCVISKNDTLLQSMEMCWRLHDKTRDSAGKAALRGFIGAANIAGFEKLFQMPDCMLRCGPGGFLGTVAMEYRPGWFRKYRWQLLVKTCRKILRDVYRLGKRERFGIGFELVPAKCTKPLEDYLDSFAIAYAMKAASARAATMTASTQRDSCLMPMNRISDLRTTLLGCELSKNFAENVFRKYGRLSPHIHGERIEVSSAVFSISGQGCSGRHLFGERIGYPAPGNKTRWQSPGGFIYKLDYFPQTRHDARPPLSRVAFTSTLPVDIFIESCNIDWLKMKKTNDRLRRIISQSERIVVSSESGSSFTVYPYGRVHGSDVSTREKINQAYRRTSGALAGTMANLPGGEVFLTPDYVHGKIVGDVIINIEESHRLSSRQPLVIETDKRGYIISDGPKKIIQLIEKKKKEAKKQLRLMKKSMPKDIFELKIRNFNRIGEFAINTNPKARICNYLIVNEKAKNMIHVALGSGFEPERTTAYHMDVVIDAMGQKLDIVGQGKRNWRIMRKGKLVA